MKFKGLKAFLDTSRDVKLLILSGFFLGFGFTGFGLILNLYLKALGYGEGIIGTFLSVRTLATMIVTIPAAFLMRRWRLKPVMLVSSALAALGALLVVYFPQATWIAAGMIIVGLMGSFSGVIGGPMIMKGTTYEHRPFLFSINFALGLVSGIFGNLLAGGLPDILARYGYSLEQGYKLSLLVHVAITFLAVVPIFFIKTERVVENHTGHFFHVKTPWGKILLLSFPHVLVGLGAGLTIPFLNLYFRDKFSLTPTGLGVLFSVVQVLMIAGTLVAPYIASRWGRIKTVIVFQLLSVPFLFILSIAVNVWLSIAAFLVRGTLMNMAQPLVTNFSLEQTHEHDHPLMSGIMTVAWLASWGVSANLGGALIEKLGYFWPFNFTLAAYILSSAAYFFLLLPMERNRSSR
ncbi:MFS transporter [candidate division WOR-3 bacterium]|nr:MFS transporter [candidate division WOR-3 bacterium]